MSIPKNINWNAYNYFSGLIAKNKLAQEKGFKTFLCSGLDGFNEALGTYQKTTSFVCVSDTSDGYIELNNSPHTRRVKTVFLARRHKIDDMSARETAMDVLRELFRQLMTRFLKEKNRLENNHLYIDSQIRFNEISRYFYNGCACAYFQITLDTYTNLMENGEEWND